MTGAAEGGSDGRRADADDARLLARAAGGDERAFGDLMTRHRSMLLATCLRITGDRQDALDALQDTLTRAWRGLGAFRGESKVSTWLYRIAVNAALAEVRRRRNRPEPTDALPEPPAHGGTVGDAVANRITVDAALRRMPPAYRAAIVLNLVCGCSYEETAEILGIPMNTVKSRISRGRQALLAQLGPSTEDPGTALGGAR